MILVDTSIWIDHLHSTEARLVRLLEDDRVCVHPMIIGELALGSLKDRALVLGLLSSLPALPVSTQPELLHFVEVQHLYSCGLSLVDAHLLASLRLTGTDTLWTRDKRLAAAAARLDVVADISLS